MSGEWREASISELCEVKRGASPRPINEWVQDSGTPWVKISDANAVQSRFIERTAEYIRDEGRDKSFVVYPGDLILSNSASPGIPRFLAIEACVHDGWLIIRKFNDLDKLFAYYLFLNERDKLIQQGNGSVFTNLKTDILKRHRVRVPPLPEQRRIAKIMGDIDDKIELNRKMNETLEQMARALFKSWFVDFDPVRAKMEGRTPTGMDAATAALFPDRLVDSELGLIPEGWEVKALGEVIECVKGRSYRSEELAESTTALVTLKSFLRGGGYRPDGLKPFIGEYKSNQRVYPGDLVIALTDVTQAADVIGKPALIRSDKQFDTLVASLDVGIIRPTDEIVSKPFLYCLFMTESFQTHAYSHSTGTTVLHLGSSAVPSYVTVLPPALVSQKFDEMAGLMVRLIDEIEIQSRTLSTLRDTLLPKLVSGEVRVGGTGTRLSDSTIQL